MADRVTKNGGFTGPAGQVDSDSASVDTLLEGVLGGDVQSAKARVPNRARQETAPGLSVIIEEDPPMGGRRRAFLPEEEQVARMAPTIPSNLRDREIPRDTVVGPGPDEGASRRDRGVPLGISVLVVLLLGVAAAGLWWGFTSAEQARRAAADAAAAAAALKITQSLPSAPVPVPSTPVAAPAVALSAASSVTAAASSAASASPAPPSTYGHLVPGGRH